MSETWINENLDNKVTYYVRKWLQIPRSGIISQLRLSSRKLGLSFQLASDIFNFCLLTVTNILKRSENDDTKTLYNLTSKNFVRYDAAISSNDNGKAVKSSYNNAVQNKIEQNLSNLKEQNTIMNHLQQVVPKYKLESWHKQIQNLPPNIFEFCRKALIFSPVKNSNLHHWEILNTTNCYLCDGKQTQLQKQPPEVLCKKRCSRNFAKFTGKHLCQSLFFNKIAGLRSATLLKKRLWHGCFPVNFAKFLRTPFIIEHLRWLLLQLYALDNCPTAATQERYTWRHDSVLNTLARYLTALVNFGFRLYAELEGYETTVTFFKLSKPDVLIKNI